MVNFSVSRCFPYRATQLFTLVSDVASYQEFIPLVKKSIVCNRIREESGAEIFDAELLIQYDVFHIMESFWSHVEADPISFTVQASSRGGAVKSLEANWRILSVGDEEAEVIFSVEVVLKSWTMQLLLSGIIDYAVGKVLNAFEERAHKLFTQSIAHREEPQPMPRTEV